MTPRRLAEHFSAYRIGDPKGIYPVYSAEGASRIAGRWHEIGDRIVYASEHCATAMLEKLAHWSGDLPPNQHFVEITIPAGLSYEVVTPDILPDWYSPDAKASQPFGHRWYNERRSAILIVPSVVARVERNVLINTQHPEFGKIKAGLETPVWWDQRLFG